MIFNFLIPQVHAATPIAGSGYISPYVSIPGSGGNVVDIGARANEGGFFGFLCINQLIFNIASLILIVSGLLVFFFFVLGGLEWIMSNGDKAKVDNARSRITNALIGLAIVAVAWAIFKIVVPVFFGINIDTLCTANPVG